MLYLVADRSRASGVVREGTVSAGDAIHVPLVDQSTRDARIQGIEVEMKVQESVSAPKEAGLLLRGGP